ncbi:DgyrCDS10793 [Dimorphilus gyrociliatus]|uniref:DgyrCDS10793 n=1 Tax=Dimorphilus gyrociliatus TaxID=2664684 RepID=A0A7I8W3U6_9ANNE|nr:DgyrCDS10793 [Dimorphilus gyrociliatus]
MPLGIGEYQPGYNPKIHGAYDPGRYYGKADPISNVKLGELSNWMGRREVSPLGAWRVVQRGKFIALVRYNISIDIQRLAPLDE